MTSKGTKRTYKTRSISPNLKKPDQNLIIEIRDSPTSVSTISPSHNFDSPTSVSKIGPLLPLHVNTSTENDVSNVVEKPEVVGDKIIKSMIGIIRDDSNLIHVRSRKSSLIVNKDDPGDSLSGYKHPSMNIHTDSSALEAFDPLSMTEKIDSKSNISLSPSNGKKYLSIFFHYFYKSTKKKISYYVQF
jgi:hypothetical protein